MVQPRVTGFLLFGENAPVILQGQTQRLVDEVTGGGEHRFAGQRTRFESRNIVVEHIRDMVNKFLRESHTPMMVSGRNDVEVDVFLRFPDEGSGPLNKRPN